MADITVRGYVNDPKKMTSAKGNAYQKFRLGVTQKKKMPDGTEKKTSYSAYVTCFNESSLTDGQYVEVTGRLEIDYSEKEGVRYTNLNIIAKDVSVPDSASACGAAPKSNKAGPAKEPWDE